jgi:2-amino-4-hydroxy-6-hydroxymethyldihydropteridine diphosphokinase
MNFTFYRSVVVQIFLGFGSNVGNRKHYLYQAVTAVTELDKSILKSTSSIYETEPWGRKDQRSFLNQVAELETILDPHDLLAACKKIERTLGRKQSEHWGARTMDIDLLIYGDRIINEETIKIPHPRLAERQFVLVPLAEIASTVFIPGLNKTVSKVLETCTDGGGIKLYESNKHHKRECFPEIPNPLLSLRDLDVVNRIQ